MTTQSFNKNNDIKSKTSHKETLKAQDLDIERESLVLPTEKGSFEREKSCKNSYDLKGEKASFQKKQERLKAAPNSPNDRIIEEAILLSAKEPISRATFDQNSTDETEICGEDQDSYPNLSIRNLHEQSQQESLKADSSRLRSYLFALKFQTNSFNSLQGLDFTRCLLGKHTIHTLCSNYDVKSLKSLILTQNPIRNDGVKFISQTSDWPKLQKLILCEVQIDYDRVKWLAINESLKNLKELDLSENPLIGDLGATSLCLNRTWKNLKTLGFCGCNVETLGIIAPRRRGNYTVHFEKDKTKIEAENQNFSLKKVSFRTTHGTQNPKKNLHNYPSTCSNWRIRNFKSTLRGGSPQGDGDSDTSDIYYSRLLIKFQQYKEKILNDTSVEKEMNLFIEVQASTIPANHHSTNNKNSSDISQHFELSFDLRRHLLHCEGSEAPKILLLTGQAGSGKSFFCKHLQRELLSDWSQSPESEDRNWFPIYVELSSLKNPKSEAISETLSRELSLTNEEILLLQALKQSNLDLPRLLFIFDGYDAIKDIYVINSLGSRQDFLDNHFSMLNKIKDASWKDAKFIITCREENLQKVQRRDMLYVPLVNPEATELLTVPGSFLQRKIEFFSDEQITCYLKKYYYYELKATVEESSSWSQVKKFEQLINNYHLRDMARTPFMLWIMCRTLLKLMTEEPTDEMKFILPQRPSRRFLIDFFVNELISSITKETSGASNILENKEEHKDAHQEEDHPQADLHLKIRQQAQNFALKSRGYSINKGVNDHNQNDDPSTLKLNPLLTWDNNHSQVKFGYPLLLEFFVANSIEEEIGKIDPSTLPDQLKMKKKLLINQRLLNSEASGVIIILFLIDTFKDKRLTSNQLINLIHLSREKELANQENNDEEISNASHSNSQTPFTIAASNAITILNAAGYNFGPHDLTNINIPDVNLSFGIFEGTNFKGSNLKRVDFTGAWLKNVNFVGANLESVDFGAIRKLKFQNEKIKNISYSPDGEYFAVDVGAETIIFDVVDMQKTQFKENKRFPGFFLCWRKLSRTQVLTVKEKRILTEEEQPEEEKEAEEVEQDNEGQELQDDQKEKLNVCFCIWDAISGQSIEEVNVSLGNRKLLNFDPDRKEVIAFGNQTVQKYDIASQLWIKFPVEVWNCVETRNLFARNSNMLQVGDYLRKIILFNSITGKPILKQRQEVTSCELSSDGQEMVVGTINEVICISDCVRGCSIKSLIDGSEYYYSPQIIYSCSFSVDGKQIFAKKGDRRFFLQDIADPKLDSLSLTSNTLDGPVYCLRPDGQEIAIFDESHTIFFRNLSMDANFSIQNPVIRGTNDKGLNLQGVIANSSFQMSQENIALLRKRGDYGIFNQSMIKKLFFNSSADSKDVRQVVLIGKKLAPIHAKIIASDLLWINLQRLDLSRNEIGDIGAEAIGKNETWMNLETLDLHQNKIKAEGAFAIGANNIWKKLVTLDLSSNQISDRHILIFLCSNKTWEHLQSLLLIDNPAILETSDVCKILEGIASKSLKMLVLPQTQFEQGLLQYLKYSATENVLNFSLAKRGYNDIFAEIIAANTTWTNLKKLDLKNNFISDKAGIKIGSNTSWINLEELDLSHNNLGAKSAAVLGDNATWSKLRALNLNGNKIGSKGSCAIGNNKIWIELQILELQDNLIESKGVVALCQNKTWTKLQTLNLEKNLVDVEGAAELAKNASWINLQTLNLNNNSIGAEGAAELAGNTYWINLQTLYLSSNSIGAEGAAGLARNTSWINLKTLNLNHNSIGNKGTAELARNASWINLQTLELSFNKIDAEGAAELARSTSWINLQALYLSSNSIDAQGAAELARNTSWINLQALYLSSNSIGAKGAAELTRNTSWINLQTLNLTNNSIRAEGAAELARNESWINLQTLDLGYNLISAEGAAELAINSSWTSLQTLDLNNNSISDKGAADLARNTSWINLQTLYLSSNSIGDKGAAELARNTSWTNLQTLELSSNKIRAEGAAELARNASWINLQTLNLNNNTIGAEGAAELARNTSWINLQTLELSINKIGAEGATELASNISWINLKTLELRTNSIGDKGAAELARNTSWMNLQTLELRTNLIGAEGAAELARNASWINLQTLDLRTNLIGDKGAAELARNTSWVNLQTLNLYYNKIGAEGATGLARNTSWINLQTLDLRTNLIGDKGAESC